jgi:hypothetical protein
MRRRSTRGESWTDVYGEGTFSGRLHRLGPGEATRIDRVGSIVVGPKAIASIVTARRREVLKLKPRTVVANTSDLALSGDHFYLRVSKVRG